MPRYGFGGPGGLRRGPGGPGRGPGGFGRRPGRPGGFGGFGHRGGFGRGPHVPPPHRHHYRGSGCFGPGCMGCCVALTVIGAIAASVVALLVLLIV